MTAIREALRELRAAQPAARENHRTQLIDLAVQAIEAMQERASWIVEHPVFPVDHTGRRYPWPLV